MTKIIRKFEDLEELNGLVGTLWAKDKTIENTKFGYAFKSFMKKNYIPTEKERQEKINDIRINNALENKDTKEILRDTDRTNLRGFKYSKEGLKKCVKEERKVNDEFYATEIEITPVISSFVPEMEEYLKELLKGLVI